MQHHMFDLVGRDEWLCPECGRRVRLRRGFVQILTEGNPHAWHAGGTGPRNQAVEVDDCDLSPELMRPFLAVLQAIQEGRDDL